MLGFYNDILEQQYFKRLLNVIKTFENGVYRHENAENGKVGRERLRRDLNVVVFARKWEGVPAFSIDPTRSTA